MKLEIGQFVRTRTGIIDKIVDITYNDDISSIVCSKTHTKANFQFNEDNEEYLKICLMNLYEKHIRNMIPKEEWQIIYDKFKEYLD